MFRKNFHLSSPSWLPYGLWSPSGELAEPTQHRPPIPEPVVKAMTHRVCCGDGCCFQPSSCAVSTASVVLVKFCVLQGKTFWHQKISCPMNLLRTWKLLCQRAVGAARRRSMQRFASRELSNLSAVLAEFPRDSLLYPSSPSNFRRRWDATLSVIGIEKLHRLTLDHFEEAELSEPTKLASPLQICFGEWGCSTRRL